MVNLDLMIFGSSRPQLLKYTYESFQKYVENLVTTTKISKLLNEDFIYSAKSIESVKYATKNGFQVFENIPNIGLGESMRRRILESKSDYIFYLQDDWEFEQPVDLDRLVWIMNKHPEINCITFNKYRNMKPTDFEDREYTFEGVKFCICPGWQFLPGIWRTSLVKNMWFKHGTRKVRPEGYWQNLFGSHQQRLDHKHLENKVGSYFYGGFGEYRYVRHIGGTWRMADWQRNNNKPGGVVHWEFVNVERDRCPWLGEFAERPMNKDIKLNNEGKEVYKRQPENIKKIFKYSIK